MNRIKTLFIIFLVCIIMLILRLGTIQVLKSEQIQASLYDQRYKQFLLYKDKGDILDRNRIPFTSSDVESVLIMNYETYLKNKLLFNEIDNYIYLSLSPGSPVLLRTGAKEGQTIKDTLMDDVVRLKVKNTNPSVAKHVIGYRSGYNQEGLDGLLKKYDELLDCDTSVNYAVMQDINGGVILESEPRIMLKGDQYRPQNVVLTLDIHMQSIAEKHLSDTKKAGSVIIQDCNTGYLFAMASAPDYKLDYTGEFLTGNKGELINRATCEYNPGSVMKLVVAAAVLETSNTSDFNYTCSGFYRLQGRTVSCSAHSFDRERKVDLSEAVSVSCNSYFINAAKKLGYEKIYQKAVQLGLTEQTGLADQIPEEDGYLPLPEKVKSDVDLINLVLGQWVSKVTPLQICNMTSTIANGGILNKVNLVNSVVNMQGQKVLDLTDKKGERILSRNIAKRLSGFMSRCVQSGTGKLADPDGLLEAAGKTGTAGEKEGHNIVWFTGFFPSQNPKYTITVVLEDAVSGSLDAAPVFNKIATEVMELS